MFPSILINIGVALGGVALLTAVVLVWSWRRDRKEAKMMRERSPHATLPPHPRHDDTDRWNLTR